jgi:uncharacterized SAM-binding protein YcdF (DUF218 family)
MASFLLYKLLGIFVDPLAILLLLLLIVFLLLRRGRLSGARRLLGLVVTVMLLVTVLPVGEWLLYRLEQRFPALALPAKVDGIIMLGGAQQPRLTAAYKQPALNGAAERMTTFLALARRYPEAKIAFSGGSGDPFHPELHEGLTVRLFLEQQGFDPERVIYESSSRNTYENIVNSKQMLRPQDKEVWLLVQSAADIPRAMGVFHRLGWRITPVPCDYNALGWNWLPSLSITQTFALLEHAMHEWAGLLVYHWTDKTDRLFPAPGN